MFCSHIRAVHIFLETLFNELSPNKCKFIAFKCRNGIQSFENGQCFPEIDNDTDALSIQMKYRGDVGYFAEKSIGNGVMYFVTRDSRPFCGNLINVSQPILHTIIIFQVYRYKHPFIYHKQITLYEAILNYNYISIQITP